MQDNRNHNEQDRVKSMKVIVFIVILAGLVGLLSNTIEYVLCGHDKLAPEPSRYIFQFEREKEDSIDILVLGDSLSLSSISPLSDRLLDGSFPWRSTISLYSRSVSSSKSSI